MVRVLALVPGTCAARHAAQRTLGQQRDLEAPAPLAAVSVGAAVQRMSGAVKEQAEWTGPWPRERRRRRPAAGGPEDARRGVQSRSSSARPREARRHLDRQFRRPARPAPTRATRASRPAAARRTAHRTRRRHSRGMRARDAEERGALPPAAAPPLHRALRARLAHAGKGVHTRYQRPGPGHHRAVSVRPQGGCFRQDEQAPGRLAPQRGLGGVAAGRATTKGEAATDCHRGGDAAPRRAHVRAADAHRLHPAPHAVSVRRRCTGRALALVDSHRVHAAGRPQQRVPQH